MDLSLSLVCKNKSVEGSISVLMTVQSILPSKFGSGWTAEVDSANISQIQLFYISFSEGSIL